MQLSQVTQNGPVDDVTVPSLSDQTVCVRKMMTDCVVIVCVVPMAAIGMAVIAKLL